MREHWSLDPHLRYLNHGSFGAVPRVTQAEHRRLRKQCETNPMRWFRELPDRILDCRERIAGYLGATGPEIALVPNATTGVNTALRSLPMRPGGRLVTTSHAYGAVLLAMRRVAAEHGCEVQVVDLPIDADDDSVVAAISAVLDDRTCCLVVDQVTSATAKLLPVRRLAAIGRARSVPVIVDGAHAPALIDDPITGDFWTGNLHKWPCAPRGTGVLWVDPAWRGEVRSPVVSWGEEAGFPTMFDFPGTTDATGWIAAPTSLALLTDLGFGGRRKDLGVLADAGAAAIAAAVGGSVADVGAPAPTMRLVRLPSALVRDETEAGRLGSYLAARSEAEVAVTCWQGEGFIRLSAHLYNVERDYTATAAQYEALFADRDALARAVRGR